MNYPNCLLSESVQIVPLFGSQLSGLPYIFDFTSQNPRTLAMEPGEFDLFQEIIFSELKESGKSWGIGNYLEERANVLRRYPQMIRENRIYHLGLDIVVPEGYELFSPLPAIVEMAGKEEGLGNYGGYVMLRHDINETRFYSFYGHLDSQHLVSPGDGLAPGQVFAKIGNGEDSGGWFTHTHLQILTAQAFDEGRHFQGYIAADDLPQLENLFPHPGYLFRY